MSCDDEGSGCGCGKNTTVIVPSYGAGQAPYYAKVSMCAEDNAQYMLVEKLVASMENAAAFAMPACGASVRVQFKHVGQVPIGAWMWANGLGVLTIIGFNSETGEIELRNDCPENPCQAQAAPGTPIPKCTVWMLSIPLCSNSLSNGSPLSAFPYLNSGFTAPANGDCVDIVVTTTNSLSVNSAVNIQGSTYRVSAIESATLITICNDGEGITPGTVVEYEDAAGNLTTPITLIQSNPCEMEAVNSGAILVCKDGATRKLDGSLNGQVPVFDSETGEVNFRTLGVPTLNCTELAVCLTLDPELPEGTAYLVTVEDTDGFSEDDTVLIGGTEFTITDIVSATQLRIVPEVHPSAVQTYNVGATLCSADCCTILNNRLDIHNTRIHTVEDYLLHNIACSPDGIWFSQDTDFVEATAYAGGYMDTPSSSLNGNVASKTLTNNSCVNKMRYLAIVTYFWRYEIANGSAGQYVRTYQEAYFARGPLGSETLGNVTTHRKTHLWFATDDNRVMDSHSFVHTISGTINPGGTTTLRARATANRGTGTLSGSVIVHELNARIAVIAIAIKD